jgi:hypothetical protein
LPKALKEDHFAQSHLNFVSLRIGKTVKMAAAACLIFQKQKNDCKNGRLLDVA